MKMIGAVDIGGTKIAVGGIRDDGTIAYRCECLTESAKGFHDAMQRLKDMLWAVAAACTRLDGIGIACPGPLDPFTGIIGDVGTLPGWQGGNLVEELQSEFGVTVAVENDADAAALAEANWGAAKGTQNFIYITVSTGIGGGIILAGELYRGAGGSHPELGHQIIDGSGPLCYCKAHGCWESLASGSAMSSWVRDQESNALPLTAEAICELARQGNELALRAVQREGYYLALGLSNLVTLFTPDMIALGGGVMKSSSLFLDDALKVVRDVCTQVPAEKTQITLASLGSEAGLLGAAQAWLCRSRQWKPGVDQAVDALQSG
jgi:glucokinase